MLFPRCPGLARIFEPCKSSCEPRRADDVDPTVAIYVEREIAEVVDVVVREVQLAKLMATPARRFIPILAGDNVGTPVAADVGDGAGFVRAEVQSVFFEGYVGGTRQRPQAGSRCHGE